MQLELHAFKYRFEGVYYVFSTFNGCAVALVL